MQRLALKAEWAVPYRWKSIMVQGNHSGFLQLETCDFPDRGSHKQERHILTWAARRWGFPYRKSEFPIRVEPDQDSQVNPTNHSYFNLSGNLVSRLISACPPAAPQGCIKLLWRFASKTDADRVRWSSAEEIFADPGTVNSGLRWIILILTKSRKAGAFYDAASGRYLTFRLLLVSWLVGHFVDESVGSQWFSIMV